jgi:hypothetical protein
MSVVWEEVAAAQLPSALAAPAAAGVYWQADADTFLLELPNVVRFLVERGAIRYARLGDDASAATVRMIGGGLPTAAAWVQRGCLALHAAAVATPAGAVVLAGASASGKSVLAATLAQRGYPILADEVTPLGVSDDCPLSLAAHQHAEPLLWQDALTHLGLDAVALTPVRPGLARFAVAGLAAPSPVADKPAVAAIFLLGVHNQPEVRCTQLEGRSRVLAVMNAAYNRYLPQSPALRQRTFLQVTAQLAATPVYWLLRPRSGWSAPAVADCLLEHIAQ